MTQIGLTGLDGSNPMAAMAAFGLLRVLHGHPGLKGSVRLGWEESVTWYPVLHLPQDLDHDQLLELMLQWHRNRAGDPVFGWGDDLKWRRDEYLNLVAGAQGASDSKDQLAWLAAFASDQVSMSSKDGLKPTPLYMTAGQQRFLVMARELAQSLSPEEQAGARHKKGAPPPADQVVSSYHEALFGPWKYADPVHSMGWDPSTERLHALRAKSPTSESALGVRAAIWLAYESLPLFPVSAVVRGRQVRVRHAVAAFTRDDEFRWPIWEPPIGLRTLQALLVTPDLLEPSIPKGLRTRGVRVVFGSARVQSDKGYGIFRPSQAVPFAEG